VRIASAHLRNFRCFPSLEVDLENPLVLIHGPNGSGKTSLLEALHYACYLRSFKTHLPKDIVRTNTEGFGINLGIVSENFDSLHVQFNKNKKTVKLNEQVIGSYKELYDAYRVVTITEDDLLTIQGAPSLRRTFLDHMVLLMNPDHAALGRKYKAIVDNRTALIAKGRIDDDSYGLWTNQLLIHSRAMQAARKAMLVALAEEAQQIATHLPGMREQEGPILQMAYEYARPYKDIEDITTTEELMVRYPSLMNHELQQKRSLIGAHLDDFSILYLNKACRSFASRGQQKLIVFLLKLAHIKRISQSATLGTILLVDDFMTDFDDERMDALLSLMTTYASQVIITTPSEAVLKGKLASFNPHVIDLKSR
jgi:DNA replication and repair protein RecF